MKTFCKAHGRFGNISQVSLEDSPQPLACYLLEGSPAHCPAVQWPPEPVASCHTEPVLPLLLQGTVLCDIILLNFLKGADQYKAKKFEEVSWRCGGGARDVEGRGREGH